MSYLLSIHISIHRVYSFSLLSCFIIACHFISLSYISVFDINCSFCCISQILKFRLYLILYSRISSRSYSIVVGYWLIISRI